MTHLEVPLQVAAPQGLGGAGVHLHRFGVEHQLDRHKVRKHFLWAETRKSHKQCCPKGSPGATSHEDQREARGLGVLLGKGSRPMLFLICLIEQIIHSHSKAAPHRDYSRNAEASFLSEAFQTGILSSAPPLGTCHSACAPLIPRTGTLQPFSLCHQWGSATSGL